MSYKNKIQIDIQANTKKAEKNINKFGKSITHLGNKIKGFSRGLQNITNLFFLGDLVQNFSSAITGYIGSIAKVADSYNPMQARLALVTDSNEELAKAQEEVLHVARETHSSIFAVSDLYIKLSRSLKSAGDGDKIKALLEPGEFIIRKSTVRKNCEKTCTR